jgi:hypothetical protein
MPCTCPNQRSTAVANGQQRSVPVAPELRHRPLTGGRTVLPKLVVPRDWSRAGIQVTYDPAGLQLDPDPIPPPMVPSDPFDGIELEVVRLDRITKSLLLEFQRNHELEQLDEPDAFERLGIFCTVSRELGEEFSLDQLCVGGGQDLGIV